MHCNFIQRRKIAFPRVVLLRQGRQPMTDYPVAQGILRISMTEENFAFKTHHLAKMHFERWIRVNLIFVAFVLRGRHHKTEQAVIRSVYEIRHRKDRLCEMLSVIEPARRPFYRIPGQSDRRSVL